MWTTICSRGCASTYDDDAIVELTMVIAWENSSSKFNRALRIPSQGLWKRVADGGGPHPAALRRGTPLPTLGEGKLRGARRG